MKSGILKRQHYLIPNLVTLQDYMACMTAPKLEDRSKTECLDGLAARNLSWPVLFMDFPVLQGCLYKIDHHRNSRRRDSKE